LSVTVFGLQLRANLFVPFAVLHLSRLRIAAEDRATGDYTQVQSIQPQLLLR